MNKFQARAVILRGLPGSGKSRKAKELVESSRLDLDIDDCVFSTDSYFYQQDSYCFDKNKLGEYHQHNLTAFINALAKKQPLVICDNTNITCWEFSAYLAAAKSLGYQCEVLTVGETTNTEFQQLCASRNKHQVPLEVIQQMAGAFQEFSDED